jgi:hypothetical protein
VSEGVEGSTGSQTVQKCLLKWLKPKEIRKHNGFYLSRVSTVVLVESIGSGKRLGFRNF